MASADDITSVVRNYLDEVATGTGTSIAALFTPEATVEDPVGSDPRVGTAAITEFYGALEQATRKTKLLALKVAGNSAAFHFRVITIAGEQTITVEPIDVMTFDEQSRITSMRAFWSNDDLTVA